MRNPSPGSCRGGSGRPGEGVVETGEALIATIRCTPAARNCGDIVAGVQGLAQQLPADASGGSDDRELHGFLLLLAPDRSRPVPGTPVGRTPCGDRPDNRDL